MFDDYVVARGPGLLRFAFLLTGDRHLAEDLVQEVLAKAHRRWRRIEQLDQPDSYVRKAMVNQYLSWRRRRSYGETATGEVPDSAGHADHAARLADRDAMWTMLAALPRQQRAVLVLRFYEDLPDAQIAELIGCSVATVRAHASRALTRLRAGFPTETSLMGGQP
jgi:RNA polymerase sigma-70 factor (sigma-E family)